MMPRVPITPESSIDSRSRVSYLLGDLQGPVGPRGPQGPQGPFTGITSRLGRAPNGPVKILFLGSSTTFGTNASHADRSYVNLVAKSLQSVFSSGVPGWEPPVLNTSAGVIPNLPGLHVFNGAVGGTFSNDYCSASVLDFCSDVSPDIVVHMIGANDYRTGSISPSQTQNNIVAAIEDIEAACLVPPFQIVLSTYASPDTLTPAYPWSEYVEAMDNAANSFSQGTLFLDILPAFVQHWATGPSASDPFNLIHTDNVHLTDDGYAVMAAEIMRLLAVGSNINLVEFDVVDRFRRKALGSTESGQAWVQQSGTHVPNGSYLTCTLAGNAVIDTGFSDVEISAVLFYSSTAVSGVIAKSTDVNTRIGFYINGPSSRVELYRGPSILTWGPVVGYVNGTEYHLRLYVKNDVVRCYLDGKLVISYTLAPADAVTYNGYTSHGVRANNISGGPKWRNLGIRAV